MTSCAFKCQKQTTNEPRLIIVSIPFVEGLSQVVCRLARATGVRCAFLGETLRPLRVRKKEHCDAIRFGQIYKSAITEHVPEQSMPHEIDWQGMKAIDRARWKMERKVREAFRIQKHKQ